MKKVLVDVNIFMDVLQAREGTRSSSWTLSILSEQDEYCGFVSALTIPILHHFESRKYSDLEARMSVREILIGFTVVDLTDELIQRAFDEDSISDFEDCIQYHSAKAALCNAIITRNTRDFRKVELNIYTPEEFLSTARSDS
jgi:predicted nucleic acid-binding protein